MSANEIRPWSQRVQVLYIDSGRNTEQNKTRKNLDINNSE